MIMIDEERRAENRRDSDRLVREGKLTPVLWTQISIPLTFEQNCYVRSFQFFEGDKKFREGETNGPDTAVVQEIEDICLA
jgi:hypothetical protein